MSEKLTDDILMTCHYPDLVSASDRLKLYSDLGRERHHQYGISALVPQTSFHGEARPITKCWLFSQAMNRCPKGDVLMY